MEKRKGLLTIMMTASLLFLAQGCYWDHHGYGDDWKDRDSRDDRYYRDEHRDRHDGHDRQDYRYDHR